MNVMLEKVTVMNMYILNLKYEDVDFTDFYGGAGPLVSYMEEFVNL